MSLLNFEGVQVDIPSIDGIEFHFVNGNLHIQCNNFTGEFCLNKSKKRTSSTFPANTSKKPKGSIEKENIVATPLLSPNLKLQSKKDDRIESKQTMLSPIQNIVPATQPNTFVKGRRRGKKNNTSTSTKRIEETPPQRRRTRNTISPIISTTQGGILGHFQRLTQAPKGTKPTGGRYGHTVTPITTNHLFLYGGDNSDKLSQGGLYIYNIEKNCWTCPINCTNIPRSWHSCVFIESHKLLLTFGGEQRTKNSCGRKDDPLPEFLTDIMVLDTDVHLWYPPGFSGNLPSARSGHSMCLMENNVVVFGGFKGRKWYNDVCLLDIDTWCWRSIRVGGQAPVGRSYHSATVIGNKIVIFGGRNSKKCFQDVHVLQHENPDTWSWFCPIVLGSGPGSRSGHSATLMDDRNILVYGGQDTTNGTKLDSTIVFRDAYVLDTVSWEWRAVFLESTCDSHVLQRHGHAAVKVKTEESGETKILIFGGEDVTKQQDDDVYMLTLTL